ncbi:hypothetical protein BGZ79_004236 [Entomortierella chlamydospora]|nr:hypothetical protein BGZ79_004236 [Entomortierella chlamydospora]
MGNQNSKRTGPKVNRSSSILDPNVNSINNNPKSDPSTNHTHTPKDKKKTSNGNNLAVSNQDTNDSSNIRATKSSSSSKTSNNGPNGSSNERSKTSKETNRSSWQGSSTTPSDVSTSPSSDAGLSTEATEATEAGTTGAAAVAKKRHSKPTPAQKADEREHSHPRGDLGSGSTTASSATAVSPTNDYNDSDQISGSSSKESGAGTTRSTNDVGSLQTARHSLDANAQTTNGNLNSHNFPEAKTDNHSSPQKQTQNQSKAASHDLNHDTPPEQGQYGDQHQPQQEQYQSPQLSMPSIPFAVSTPGNPILIKKHNLSPLTIPGHTSRSSPPSLSPSPKSGQKRSSELSPSARLSFLGGSSAEKNNKPMDIDDIISRLLDAGYSGKVSKAICLKNSEILFVCQTAREIFLSQPTLIELSPPVKIVGDIHGQYTDLLRLFEMCGFPPSANFLFMGDYVDRGKMSLETILLLFCYKIKYPENFFLLRGNHECANVTRVYGFYDECKRRASIKMWKAFVDVFNCLPLTAIVANKIFCVHGGLSPSLGSMDDIRAIRRPTDVPDYGLLNDLLWSDPSEAALDWEDNERGVSYCFGKSIIQNFLNRHDFDLVCRAHMVVEDGYEFFNDRTLVTVFSAPNYCGEFDNYGAVMSVNEDLLCSFELLKPIDQATARAQMQSLAASAGGWRVNKQRLSLMDNTSSYGTS